MFDVVARIPNLTIQPIVMTYNLRNGDKISDDRKMVDNYSCPANAKIEKYNEDFGKSELVPTKERSLFGHVFHIMKLGGLRVELNLLPPPPLANMDRKEIAITLHKIISDKFYELKDSKNGKTAITPTRAEDFSKWYQNVIIADLAENSPVRGCMTIKPYGWAMGIDAR